MSLPLHSACKSFVFALLTFNIGSGALNARENWIELNVGPYYLDTSGQPSAARDALTQLEQVRWVLGGLLEERDLRSTWPIRVLLTDSAGATCSFAGSKSGGQAESQLSLVPLQESIKGAAFQAPPILHAQYLLACRPGAQLPLGEIAGILLDSNTPRLPADIESGIRSLFDTLEAQGSRVTWGSAPPEPDLAWARMQLFATKFEYSASFHIFLTALKHGSTLRSAAQNAFGQTFDALEKEAAARLAQGHWPAATVSGRPLDPKRDFGVHSLDPVVAGVYVADAKLPGSVREAQQAYRAAVEAGGPAAALGHEGLAQLAQLENGNPNLELENAVRSGSHSAPVYLASSTDLPPEQAVALLKKARLYNPAWGEPLVAQALLTEDRKEKADLLKQASTLSPREPELWIQLAKVQTELGLASAAQGSWLRAEEAAPTPVARVQIQKQRQDSEGNRLDAAQRAQDAERNRSYYADQRAQKTQGDRVKAAETKANSALAAESSGSDTSAGAVPWSDVVPQRKFEGSIVRVDCLGSDAKLNLKDRSGAAVQLLLKNASDAKLACGNQQPARRVTITYAADPDERFGTAGTVSTMNLWPNH